MIYTSTTGKQMVYAEQYTNRESIEKIKRLSRNVCEIEGGIIVDNLFAEPGQFVIMTTMGVIIIKDQADFCERFVPGTYQKELF